MMGGGEVSVDRTVNRVIGIVVVVVIVVVSCGVVVIVVAVAVVVIVVETAYCCGVGRKAFFIASLILCSISMRSW